MMAQAPGNAVIATLALRQALIRRKPGSEIAGVPASDTRAIVFPD